MILFQTYKLSRHQSKYNYQQNNHCRCDSAARYQTQQQKTWSKKKVLSTIQSPRASQDNLHFRKSWWLLDFRCQTSTPPARRLEQIPRQTRTLGTCKRQRTWVSDVLCSADKSIEARVTEPLQFKKEVQWPCIAFLLFRVPAHAKGFTIIIF